MHIFLKFKWNSYNFGTQANILQWNLQNMWSESSSVSIVNLEKKFTTVTEISNFPRGLLFGAPYRFRKRARIPYPVVTTRAKTARLLVFSLSKFHHIRDHSAHSSATHSIGWKLQKLADLAFKCYNGTASTWSMNCFSPRTSGLA